MKCVKQVTVMLITCLPMVGPLLVVIFMKKMLETIASHHNLG